MAFPIDYAEHASCVLHNLPCCSVCCRHEGECDYGLCGRPAVETIDCFNTGGRVSERRPTCKRHANYGPAGVGYDLRPTMEQVA